MVIRFNNLDHGGYLVSLKPSLAEFADPPLKQLRILGVRRRDPRDDDFSGYRIRPAANRYIFDVFQLQKNVLDLGRMHFLAADVDQFGFAAEYPHVLAVDLDEVLGVEPPVRLEG